MNKINNTDRNDEDEEEELFEAFTEAGEEDDANTDFAWEAQAETMDIE